MAPPPLRPGNYHIFSKIRNRPVGRATPEDDSLLPKRIYALSESEQSHHGTLFELRPTRESGQFHLKCGGNDVGVIDGGLFAILQPHGKNVAFAFTPRFHQGKDLYSIERVGAETGWVAGVEDNTQIEVKLLIVGPSLPPTFPPTELFRVVPVEKD